MGKLAKGKVFLPTEVSESIVMPDDDVMITLRNSTNVKNIPLGGWFVNDAIKLCKKLFVRTISIPRQSRAVQNISDHVHQEIVNLNTREQLNIIGGFQTKDKANFEALFYKQDLAPQVQPQFIMHNLTCEQWGSDEEQLKQIEENIQNVHLEHNGVLRCILTMTEPGSEKKCHTLIFSVTDGDKMYHVMNFHEYLQEKLEIDLDDK